MIKFLVFLIAFLITVPIIATVAAYLFFRKIYAQKWKAIHRAVHWTTIFYVIAVSLLLKIIFNRGFVSAIIILLLSILAVIIFYQWKVHVEVEMGKALKVLWRFCFLLFLVAYILLVIVGIIQRIFY